LQVSKDLLSIQYLRGFAACAVVLLHAGVPGPGAAGVDLFFVISGFIMWVVSDARSLKPSEFMARRITRIVPLYWAVTLGTVFMAAGIPGAFPNIRLTVSQVISSIFFVPHRDATGHIYPVIVPGWSLNYEMFFYVIFATGLMLPPRLRLRFVATTLLAFVAAGRAITFDSPVWLTYTSPLLLEFLAGVLLGAAHTSRVRLPPWVSLLLIVVGLAGFAATTALGSELDAWRAVRWGVPAASIVMGAVFYERSVAIVHWRLPRLIGDASYSLYLVHGFAISFVFRSFGMLHLPLQVKIGASVIAGVAAGIITYLTVERPLQHIMSPQRRAAHAVRAAVTSAA
jgi:exopolysaccharide production protein ExoZ